MSSNPYSPPTAAVADIAPEMPMERPSQIGLAVRLLWVGVILGLIPNVYQIVAAVFGLEAEPTSTLIGAAFGIVVGTAIAAWFIGKIALGRNWARILMVVFMVISYIGVAMYWVLPIPITQLQKVVGTVQCAINTVSLYLVWFGPGSLWFKR